MEYEELGERYIVRLSSGEAVVEQIAGLLASRELGFANISAAGAVRGARLAYWDPVSKQYRARQFDEQLEAVSFQGNAALKDGKPFLHVHAAFARSDYSVIGGHVQEAWVHPTFEVWLRPEDVPVVRAKDPDTGLDLLRLR